MIAVSPAAGGGPPGAMQAERVEEIRELFHSYLRRNGLKKTRQKDLILEAFLGAEGHLSVEDVYEIVKKKDRRIGIVTVFRTLKSLTACGIAREADLGDGLTRFEHCYRHPEHHHIVCTECRRAIEFIAPELERIQQRIVDRYRFRPVLRRFQIYGVCEDCRQKRPRADERGCDTERVFERDALLMALHMERRAVEFYRRAAERNEDPAGRAILLRVAEEEERHLGQLAAGLNEIERREKGIGRAPALLHFDPGDLERLFPDLREYEADGRLRLDAQRALELAASMERRSAEYFRRFAEEFEDSAGKEILRRYAEREMEHCARIAGANG